MSVVPFDEGGTRPSLDRKSRREQLDFIYERDEATCWFCRKHVLRRDASRDHIVPQSLGGTDDMDNLVLAHKKCNSKRGNCHQDILFLEMDPEKETRRAYLIEDGTMMVRAARTRDGRVVVVVSKQVRDFTFSPAQTVVELPTSDYSRE